MCPLKTRQAFVYNINLFFAKDMSQSFGKRRSIRLQGLNYSGAGFYFVTICTDNKKHLFGKIIDNEMHWNAAGEAARKCWLEIPAHYPDVKLDVFIIMPNHVHGILIIENNTDTRAQDIVPLQSRYQKTLSGSIGVIVRGYKIGVSKWFRQNTQIKDVWQKNYYEHVIRKEESLLKIQEYILNNPAAWEKDKFFCENYLE